MSDIKRNTFSIPKVYNQKNIEDKWYQHWLDNGYFHAKINPEKVPFTIVIPPPNITGMLTMGHVLNNTMQDILIRKARMEGKEACWFPGTDHASIATENKVVKMLAEKGLSKEEVGREEFLKYSWKWKKKYGGIIIQQLKKLGCSCDWDRERFTMDDEYTLAVQEAFVRLYHKGLIYRGYRLVNWCPISKSAISDEEVIHREIQGKLWYFRYPIVDSETYVVVATTRPETMLGDTAVAVNPDDVRFKSLIGKMVKLPLAGRDIPIISDEYVDPEFGTGCVKVTPAHDSNDFDVGERHNLEFINIMNPDASLNENVPVRYRTLSREEARRLVVEDLEAIGLLEKVEDYTNKVGYSDRGNVPIEYFMSNQWFLKMSDLAKPAMESVRTGNINFYPDYWVKTYYHWMENIKDWCISRQLWWGHRIPVWTHNKTSELHVSVDPPNDEKNWTQEPDVLDTWASSWLWPFAIQGWPDKSKELEYFYPTDVLITGPDIIFFWVARMIMAGYEFLGEIPFREVYFTSILRDNQGRKFSKSLGNSPDPFDLFEQYGTDAVRFGIMLMAPQGLDVLFSNERLEVGRNFMNKLWNATRFLLMNTDDVTPKFLTDIDTEQFELSDRWILSRMNQTINKIESYYTSFRFNEIAIQIYDFTWSDFCDWYVEIIKSRLYGDDEEAKVQVFTIAVHVVKTILKLLHPYAPFITEELWHRIHDACPRLAENESADIITAPWPTIEESFISDIAENEMNLLQKVVTGIRTVRSTMNVPPGKKCNLIVRADSKDMDFINSHTSTICLLSKVERINGRSDIQQPNHSATLIVEKMELFIPLEGLIDIEKEKQRLWDEVERLEEKLERVRKKLKNKNFIIKAPDEVVEKEHRKLNDITQTLTKLKLNYEILL